MKIVFLGDIMLGREIKKCSNKDLISDKLKELLNNNYCVANLESPIIEKNEDDEFHFLGDEKTLKKVNFVNLFSIANNHINDAKNVGIDSTIKNLKKNDFEYNGAYLNEYIPYNISENISIYMCTDFSNIKVNNDDPIKINFTNEEKILKFLNDYKNKFKIIYLHGGIMFSRYPNSSNREFCKRLIDKGADLIIMVHPHVNGGYEIYKNKLIHYSLGDFIMDGKSFRRRSSSVLEIDINDNHSYSWKIHPCYINKKFITKNKFFIYKLYEKLILKKVRKVLEANTNEYMYHKKYKKKYPIQLIHHSISTILFILFNYGPFYILRLYRRRSNDFKNMFKWILKDTSKMKDNLEDHTML